jgi:hypothetical protein
MRRRQACCTTDGYDFNDVYPFKRVHGIRMVLSVRKAGIASAAPCFRAPFDVRFSIEDLKIVQLCQSTKLGPE